MSAGKGKFTAIPERESLTTEFKSDRKGLPDKILVDEVVGMANASGGRIFLGVEDDGRPTGVRAEHEDPTGLMALVANRTVPPVSVEARLVRAGTSRVMEIVVPKGISVISSSDGRVVRRRLRQDGEPEIVPMFPYEYATRLSDLGRMDFSARTIDQASRLDLDPNERERLRNVIRNRDGDRSLLALSDEELDKALGLVAETPAGLKPTVAGMLVIGRRESLRKYVPTHAEAFQALDGNVVRIDDSTNEPILAAVEHFERNLTPWNPEDEFTLDMARIPVPLFSVDGFREALVNAFCHRNYSILGTVSVQVAVGQGLTVSSPGGFIDGVSLQNLLTVQPHGRNPALADILKRTGLAEKTGRGIDRIFEGAIDHLDSGGNGAEALKRGKNGADIVLEVPQGVVVKDAETEEDKKSTALVEIRAEILQQLQVSATEFEKQIQIFKNSFGYAAAKQVKDMGEITISYTEHTMTIPCYMTVNKKVVKFDVIYNMNKKTWRFEPW